MGVSRQELETLYRQYAPVLFRRARRLVGRDAEAWDVVQQVFERLMTSSEAFRREATPMTWLWRITTNVALNHLRGRSLREPDGKASAEEHSQDDGIEARNLIAVWLKQLDEREATVATLLYVDGLTQEEVADVLGLSRKTIGREVEQLRQKAAALGALPKKELAHG
ncbi:MAG: sigma-70 family RNA polymerase sigma factor [Myxococcaceae bacterium]